MPSALAEPLAAGLFPPGVLVGVSDEPGDPGSLFPTEVAAVVSAVPKRRREFAAGRTLARALLERLGVEHGTIPAGPDRAPVWPIGVTGSISHADGLCVVAVARCGDIAALGVDAEPAEPLDEELWPTIASPAELDGIRSLPAAERGLRVRLLFSAKEAVFKCQFPLRRAPLEFTHVSIRFLSDGVGEGGFEPTFSDQARRRWGCPEGVRGRWFMRAGWVLAGAWVEAGAGANPRPRIGRRP